MKTTSCRVGKGAEPSGKFTFHFLRLSNFLVAAGRALRQEEIPWESKEMPRPAAQLGAVGAGAFLGQWASAWLPALGAALKAQRWKNLGLIGFSRKNLIQQNYLSASKKISFYLPRQEFFPKYLLSTSRVADAMLVTQVPLPSFTWNLFTRQNERDD